MTQRLSSPAQSLSDYSFPDETSQVETVSFMEELEARLLLAAAPVAMHDFSIRRLGSARPAAYSSAVGMTPTQVRHAYGFDQVMFGSIVGDGSGQTIAIVDAYDNPNIISDLRAFDLAMGLPDPPNFTVINQNGTTTRPSVDPSGKGNSWAVEIALDVQWAHAMAPKANLLLVEASSASVSDLFKAVDTARKWSGVSVISMSWGATEWSGELSYDTYFTTPAGHNGVTFIASSGDSGAYDYYSTRSMITSYPSSSPNVISVGGTYLSLTDGGDYSSEIGWGNGTSSGTSGGSGGGLSKYESQPAYQKGVVTQSTTYRATPDVALLADPASGVAVYDSYDFGAATPWVQVGGTSLAAPLWAGVIAIADQGRALAGLGTLDGKTETLPKLYGLPAGDFHDITTGNNGYATAIGYDLVTGRGTPIVNALVQDMVGAPPAPIPAIGSFTVTPTSGLAGTSITLTALDVKEVSGNATISAVNFYLESNSLVNLQTATDTFLGVGTQNDTTWTLTYDTTGLQTGIYTLYAQAVDSSDVSSAVQGTAYRVTAPAPNNDNFAAAAALAGDTANATGNNSTATREVGEPLILRNLGGKSVWWSWTAPADGKVTLTTKGSDFDTLLGIYTGTAVSALKLVTQNDDTSIRDKTSTAVFSVLAGTTYYIAVDGYNSRGTTACGNIVVNLSLARSPVNDNFANAAVVVGADLHWTGTNAQASQERGEPIITREPGGASVWLRWTAPAGGRVTINTTGSSFDTLLGVYTGMTVSSLKLVAENDDASRGILTSSLSFNAVAGATYYIDIDGYRGASGAIVLNLFQAQAPANDNFANAAVLAGDTWTGTNVGATLQQGEPRHATVPGGASVWVAWTAASSGWVSLDTTGSTFDTVLAVYTGTSVSSLTAIAANDDDLAHRLLTSALTFNAAAGTTYYFAIDGYRGMTGNIAMNLSQVLAPTLPVRR